MGSHSPKEAAVLKKLALAAVALAISAPAFADRGHRSHGHKHHVVHKNHYVKHRPVVHHYHYQPAPRRVVVVHRPQPVYYQPAPVYYHPQPNAGAAVVVGAVLGAAIAHHVVTSSY
jgi:hypothetical protein